MCHVQYIQRHMCLMEYIQKAHVPHGIHTKDTCAMWNTYTVTASAQHGTEQVCSLVELKAEAGGVEITPGAGLPMLVSSTCVVMGDRMACAPPAYHAMMRSCNHSSNSYTLQTQVTHHVCTGSLQQSFVSSVCCGFPQSSATGQVEKDSSHHSTAAVQQRTICVVVAEPSRTHDMVQHQTCSTFSCHASICLLCSLLFLCCN